MINSNILPNSVPFRDIRLGNRSGLDFVLSGPLKVTCDGVIGLPVYDFILVIKILTLTLKCQGHSLSNLMVPLNCPYMGSY